jgi:hypothetical protein
MVMAAEAGLEGPRALLDDLTEAVSLFEAQNSAGKLVTN